MLIEVPFSISVHVVVIPVLSYFYAFSISYLLFICLETEH